MALLLTAALMTAALVAGCGSTPAPVAQQPPAMPAATWPIATSLLEPGSGSWAVVQLGGSSARHDSFWELFVRPASATAWKEVTPAGVASNGGLIVAGSGTSLFAGFRPSQLLTFSPVAATTDQGTSWAQGKLVSPGLAGVPDALAAGPGGQLLALSDNGTVRLGARGGASWRSLASLHVLARSQAGRACGLTSISAVAFSGAGTPLLGGHCRKPGVVGLFAPARGSWQGVGLPLPEALRHDAVSVVGLATFTGRTTALLAVGSGAPAAIAAAWSGPNRTGNWIFSPLLRTGAGSLASQSLWPGGAAGLVLAGSRGETIAGPGAGWHQLGPLPARTATLALGPGQQLEALAGRGSTFTAWQLGTSPAVTPASAGSGTASWHLLQTIKVQIPYGSSG